MVNSFYSWYVGHTNRKVNEAAHCLVKDGYPSLFRVSLDGILYFIYTGHCNCSILHDPFNGFLHYLPKKKIINSIILIFWDK